MTSLTTTADTDMPDGGTDDASAPVSPIRRFAPIGLMVAALIAFFVFDGPSYLNMETLRANRDVLAGFVADNLLLALLVFTLAYAVMTATSIPGGLVMSIMGGFLFGAVTGTLAIVTGATIGATALFFAARTALGETLRAKVSSGNLAKFEAGLKENELSYLFVLRLIPILPFFLVNIAPALFDVKTRNYVLSTFFGIIPGSFVFASVGNGIDAVFDAGGEAQLSGLFFQPQVILPIVGLIVLALVPVAYKRFKS